MIIGGVGGVFRVGPGGSKVGYSETFFPVAVDTASEASINALIDAARPVKLSAVVRVLNAEGAWIELGDVTYFSVNSKSDGSGNGFFTVANSKKWSVNGTQNPNVLRPSYRQIQVVVTIVSRGVSYVNMLFSGTIETYSESHGQRQGTISISARPSTAAASSRTIQGLPRYTQYRKIYDECMDSGLFGPGQFPVFFCPDRQFSNAGNAMETEYITASTDLSTMIHNLVAYPTQQTRSNGGLLVSYSTSVSETEVVNTYSVNDNAAITLTRSVGGATSYNTVTVQGRLYYGVTTQTITDADDVLLRGTVASPYVYGSADLPLVENIVSAQAWIAEMLRDKLSIQLRLNPWLKPSTILKITSARLFMTDRAARIEDVTHNFRYGEAVTTLSNVAVLDDD